LIIHDINQSMFDAEGGALKKCRARFGLDQQSNWCKPCRLLSFIYIKPIAFTILLIFYFKIIHNFIKFNF